MPVISRKGVLCHHTLLGSTHRFYGDHPPMAVYPARYDHTHSANTTSNVVGRVEMRGRRIRLTS